MTPNWQPTNPEPADAAATREDDLSASSSGPEIIERGSAPSDAPIPAMVVRIQKPANVRGRVLGALLVGGIAGAVILGPLSALAASPAPTTGATSGPATTGNGTGTDTDNDNDAGHHGGPGGPGGFGGRTEAVTDTSIVAKAIGISEADLKTALAGGQTVAQVAQAHNVALQTVIDALVADSQSELAADVASGKITQAQADAMKANILQHATDQANGTFRGRP
ncbi:MAG: hypothetical protein HY264_01090 [Chloroflexi bacterium]|nr:hypothetical protein [Chloroflexota bacterium]